jgi:hypothetical protein
MRLWYASIFWLLKVLDAVMAGDGGVVADLGG